MDSYQRISQHKQRRDCANVNKKIFRLKLKSSLSSLSQLETFLNTLKEVFDIKENKFGSISISLIEGVSNSIIHGNKFAKGKFINIYAICDGSYITFSIEDEGKGFDHYCLSNPSNEKNVFNGGRGIYIIKYLSDYFYYSKSGSQLNMLFNLE